MGVLLVAVLLLVATGLRSAENPPVSQVEIVVEDENGARIPKAELILKIDSTKTVSYTGDRGSATLELPSGRYEVSVSRHGFTTQSLALDVSAPDPKTATVILKVDATPIIEYISPTFSPLQTEDSEPPRTVGPVRVPDAATAMALARAAAIKFYGRRKIEYEEPLTASLAYGIWSVEGTLCCPDRNGKRICEIGKCEGGVLTVKMRRADGKILSMTHTK